MKRREFSRDVYVQIVRRATNAAGHVVCEGCGMVLGKKPYHVDHTIPDALILQKRKLTVDDGKLLGVECCHAPKTKLDVAIIAQAKRREARHTGVKQPKGTIKTAGFPRSKPERSAKTALEPRQLFVRAET